MSVRSRLSPRIEAEKPRSMGALQWLAGVLLAIGMVGIAPAAEPPSPSLRLVSDLWCPYTCEADAPKRGILVDIVEEIFSEHGLGISYQLLPWERAKHSVENGQADIALGVSKRTKSSMLLNATPLLDDETVLIWLKGHGKPYTGVHTLDDEHIGVGYAYAFDYGELDEYIESRTKNNDKITGLYLDNHLEHLLKMLLARRIDVIVGELSAVQDLLAHPKSEELAGAADLLEVSITGKTSGMYVGFTPNRQGQEYANILDEGLAKLKSSGRVVEIVNSYKVSPNLNLIPVPEIAPGVSETLQKKGKSDR